MLSLSRERVKGAFQGRRHRRNSVGWSRGSWETKDTDHSLDSEAQRSGSQFSKQIFRHFCQWCHKKETNITIESFHISQISFFRPPFLALMNYVEAANLSSFLWSQRGKVEAGKIFFKVSHLCSLSLFPPVVCLVAIFMVGCLVIIEARGNFEVETTLDRSCLLLPSTDFTVQTNTAKW